MIKYFIRTTKERKLDESISRELGEDYTLLIDTEHKPVESFIKQLKTISNYDSVLLEDDVILCKDFKSRIEGVIKQYPKEVINFFTKPDFYFTTTKTLEVFRSNQCTYYPKGVSNLIAECMLSFKDTKTAYDIIEHWALQKLNLPHVQYRPCLVQHIDNKSIISPGCHKRRTPYFIDYLEELGVSYEEAYKYKDKLVELLNQKFKDIDKH